MARVTGNIINACSAVAERAAQASAEATPSGRNRRPAKRNATSATGTSKANATPDNGSIQHINATAPAAVTSWGNAGRSTWAM